MNRYHQEFNEGFAAQRMFGKMIDTQSQAWKDGWRHALNTHPENVFKLNWE